MIRQTLICLALLSYGHLASSIPSTCSEIKAFHNDEGCCATTPDFSTSIRCLSNSVNTGRARQVDIRTITYNSVEYTPFQFAKTLEHDSTTYMPTKAHADLLRIATSFEAPAGAIQNIVQSSSNTRKLEGLYSGIHKRLRAGAPLGTLTTPGFHEVDSLAGLCDMIENYWGNIMASKPFNSYSAPSAAVDAAVSELTTCADYTNAFFGPTPSAQNLFRGTFPGESIGPYVSQFLILPFNLGNTASDNIVRSYEFQLTQKTASEWLKIQNGEVPKSAINDGMKYIFDGKSLGAAVHGDALFQMYYTGALIGLQNGIALTNQLPDMTVSSAWKEGGPPDLFFHISSVSGGALRHSWVTKFHDHLKIRPEVMAMRMAQITDPAYDSTVRASLRAIMDNDFLTKMEDFAETRKYASSVDNTMDPDNQTLTASDSFPLLAGLYPEISPTHPAFPAGHAVVAGACTTVMKAMFVTHDENNEPLPWPSTSTPKTSDDGTTLRDVTEPITIVGELNKLAQNMEFGRFFAQVHYRSDANGILLGEEYAISYLVDVLDDYGTQFQLDKNPGESVETVTPKLMLEKFDGTKIEITRFGTTDL